MIPVLKSNKEKYSQLLENNETVFNSVDGILSKVKGDNHSDPSNGEAINLKDGDRVYSKKIKLPTSIVAGILDKKQSLVKKMSPAELSEKFPTAQYDEILKDSLIDERAYNSAKLMKAKNMAKLDLIFKAQEDYKDAKGVKDGILLKDQGLNSDLEPINKDMSESNFNPMNQVGGQLFQVEEPNFFDNLELRNTFPKLPKPMDEFGYAPSNEMIQNNGMFQGDGNPIIQEDRLYSDANFKREIPQKIIQPLVIEVPVVQSKFNKLQPSNKKKLIQNVDGLYNPNIELFQSGGVIEVPQEDRLYKDVAFQRELPQVIEVIESPVENISSKYNRLQPSNKKRLLETVDDYNYQPNNPVYQTGVQVVQDNRPYNDINLQPIIQQELPSVIEVIEPIIEQPKLSYLQRLQPKNRTVILPSGVEKFGYVPNPQSLFETRPVIQESVNPNYVVNTQGEIIQEPIILTPVINKYQNLTQKAKVINPKPINEWGYNPQQYQSGGAQNRYLGDDVEMHQAGLGKFKYDPNGFVLNKNLLPNQQILTNPQISGILDQYKYLNIAAPTNESDYGFIPSTIITEGDTHLLEHPFRKSGLGDVRAAWSNKNNKWHTKSEIDKINAIKKANNWSDQDVVNQIKDYQTQSIGLNTNGTYDQNPQWVARRAQVAKHMLSNDNKHGTVWGHQNVHPVKNEKGEIVDYTFTNYVDGDNVVDQIKFAPELEVAYNTPETTQRLPTRPLGSIPIRPPSLTEIPLTKENLPGQPTTELPTVDLEVPKELRKARMSEYFNLFNREKAVPYLRNDNQTVAYQRFIPLNTLAQERGQNFMNHTYDNSDASNQMTQSINADNYAKTLDGVSDVQLKNYQSMLNTDNQNNQLYMNAFNANELAKNNNMAEYSRNVGIVNDQFDKEGEIMQGNIKNYALQIAASNDDFAKRRLNGMLLGEKNLMQRFGRDRYGVEINKDHQYRDYKGGILSQSDVEAEKTARIIKELGLTDAQAKIFLQMQKNK